MQSLIAMVVVVLFAINGGDPLLQMFTWFSGIAAVGVVALMTGTSAAVMGYFEKHPGGASRVAAHDRPQPRRRRAGALVVVPVDNFDSLLGDPTSPLRWALPALVLAAAVVGLICGLHRCGPCGPTCTPASGTPALAPELDEDAARPARHCPARSADWSAAWSPADLRCSRDRADEGADDRSTRSTG